MSICIPRHRHFIDGQTIAWDLETTGKSVYKGDRPFAFSFCNENEDVWVFEFDVDPFTRKPIIRPKILERIKLLLEDDTIRKVGFNVKFDMMMMDVVYGIKTLGRCEDVMWRAHICNSAEKQHALKPLADKYTGGEVDKGDEEELGAAVKSCRLKVRKLNWKIAVEETDDERDSKVYKADYWLPKAVYLHAPPEMRNQLLEKFPRLRDLNRIYAGKDAVRTMVLEILYPEIMNSDKYKDGLWKTYEREMKLAPIVYQAEQVGVRIFENRCVELGQECQEKLNSLRLELTQTFGLFKKKVSDGQLRAYLHSPITQTIGPQSTRCLGLPVIVKTEKTNQPSVAKEVLNALAPDIPIVSKVQEFAKYKKVWNDYVQKYMAHAVADELGQLIVHTSFRQIGAITGRMACANPPLQQTPKRAKAGDIMKRVRFPFGPRKGKVWVHYDFKSIEPRILAEEADEKDMIAVFADTGKIYEDLAERVALATKQDYDYLDRMFEARGGVRQVCKNNFLGWSYGEGTDKLASQMGCSYEQATEIIYALRTAYPGVAPFMRYMQDLAKGQKFIVNRYGRKAVIPPPSKVLNVETGVWEWREWWYKATNYLIQGTAADMLKEAAIRLSGEDHHYAWGNVDKLVLSLPQKAGYLKGTGAEIVLFIHDEIVVEIPARLAFTNEKFVRGIGTVMANNEGMFKKVTTPTDINVTWDSWSDPEPIESLWS